MVEAASWRLIREVLLTGPADGQDILEHIKTHDQWETLYITSRSSPYAASWREAFGRERVNHAYPRSVLLIAVHTLIEMCNASLVQGHRGTIVLLSKLIANCCAENANARRIAIKAGVLRPLLCALRQGYDPNTFIPAIYNVCTELEDEEDVILTDLTIDYRSVTLYDVEVRLARCDETDGSIYSGLSTFMKPEVLANIEEDILEYFTELLDMNSKAISVAQSGYIPSNDQHFAPALAMLLSTDSGKSLASRSQLSQNAVCRALLSISTSEQAQLFVASHGLILDIALLPGPPNQSNVGNLCDDQSEVRSYDGTGVHIDAIREHQKASLLRLVYAVAQLPQFEEHISYGIAREALRMIKELTEPYNLAIAYIMLYSFVNNEQRAHLLITEGLLQPLFQTLRVQNDLQVIHPASALLAKCSTMWSLRTKLVENNALQVVQRLLLASNLGFEIPSTAVTIINFLVKGHPKHLQHVLEPDHGSSVLDDVFSLFDKGNQSICFDIGGLFIDICAAFGSGTIGGSENEQYNLEWFLSAIPQERLIKVLTFTAKHANAEDVNANRIWYALGLLVMSVTGSGVVKIVSDDPDVALKMQTVELSGGPLAENVRFVKVHLARVRQLDHHIVSNDLNQTMQQMSLS